MNEQHKSKAWQVLAVCGALCLAAALAGCGAGAKSTASSASAQSAQSQSTADASSVSHASEVQPASMDVSGYDTVRPVASIEIMPGSVVETDGALRYYTMEQKGLWGLLRADGTELLPCRATKPVASCTAPHWVWNAPLSWEEIDTWNEALARDGDGMTGCAHGYGTGYCAVISNSAQQEVLLYTYSEGGGDVTTPDAQLFKDQGGLLPVLYCDMVDNEMAGEKTPSENGEGWNFADEAGKLLKSGPWESVGWFDGEELAPVCKDGKWAYIDTKGDYVTEFIYDAAWTAFDETELAYNLRGGFASVLRDGKWGVIDSTGKEVVACEYEGAAPADGGVLLKQNDTWKLRELS